jgi:hypothetical protein
MRKPDNIVFNELTKEYDAYKKSYPVSFSSKNFEIENIDNLKIEARPFFRKKFLELKDNYDKLLKKLEWNEIIFNSNFSFKPIIGKKYYLYKNDNQYFLSIIHPKEWKKEYIGTFKLNSNQSWDKIK